MSGQVTDQIQGLTSRRSKISMTQYNRMVGAVNGLQAVFNGGPGVVSTMVAGNLRFSVTRNGSSDTFPWNLCQFGYKASTTPGSVTIMAGAVVKGMYTPIYVPQTDIAIGTSPTYAGIQTSRDMSSISVLPFASQPVTDADYVRFWFYLFQKNASNAVTLLGINLGQIMNVDITAYGD